MANNREWSFQNKTKPQLRYCFKDFPAWKNKYFKPHKMFNVCLMSEGEFCLCLFDMGIRISRLDPQTQ